MAREKNTPKPSKRASARGKPLPVSPGSRKGSSSPAGRVEACLINDNWRATGEAVIYVLGSLTPGHSAMAGFTIDLWCAGLREAWGRVRLTARDFLGAIDISAAESGLTFVACDPQLAGDLIAGGVRFAHQNGFRLPPHHERWAALLGGLGDWESADLAPFGVHGKLRWIGPLPDLRERLIGGTVEEFLDRDDVEVIMDSERYGEHEPDEPVEAEEAVGQAAEIIHQQLLSAMRCWCFANGEAPHPRLADAVTTCLQSQLSLPETRAAALLGEAAPETGLFDGLGAEGSARYAADLAPAIDQLKRFARSFPTEEAFEEALGLDQAFADLFDDGEPSGNLFEDDVDDELD